MKLDDLKIENIENSSSEKHYEKETINTYNRSRLSSIDYFDNLVGLKGVRDEIEKICNLYLYSNERRQPNGEIKGFYNLTFAGKSGTGKKTVAELVGDIFNSIGLLGTNHVTIVNRTDLTIGGDIKQLVVDNIKKALDGVLFVDNVDYLLPEDTQNQFDSGQIAVDTLLNQLVKNPRSFVLIVSGSPKGIIRFREFLAKRNYEHYFPNKIDFPDYNPDELYELLNSFAISSNLFIDEHKEKNAKDLLMAYFRYKYEHRGNDFANVHLVDAVWQDILRIISSKHISKNIPNDGIGLVTSDDIPAYIKEVTDASKIPSEEELFRELNALVGLKDLKDQLRKYIKLAKFAMDRRKKGFDLEERGFHMVFTGNPGTGKTTVARIVGKIFRRLGFLTKPEKDILFETERKKLVGKYVGETEEIVSRALEQARGGVFFIDEAYTLASSKDKESNDFGIRAIEVILKYMEDYRSDIIIIAAGYKNEMNEFLDSNPGLRSRFNDVINFADYSGDELNEIFHRKVRKVGFTIDPKLEEILPKCFEIMSHTDNKEYANARGVRKFYDEIETEFVNRVDAFEGEYSDYPLTIEDLPKNNPIVKQLFKEIKL